MNLPLQGVRIITVEQYGAGPFGSMYLADLGAEVIKIENPAIGGDVSRQTGPFFLGDNDSHFFQTFNRNKKSLTLNLKNAEGRRIFEQLVETADAVMNNLRGDQPAKLGIDYDSLKAINPRVVCAHLSAYGRDNDRADWPGYDYLMQAEAGYMSLTGEPGTPPTRFGLSMVDFMTGITTSMALLAALLNVGRGGEGRDIDVSLFDVALHQLSYPGTWFLNEGHNTERRPRSAHPSTVPCQLYKSSDGWVFAMAMTPKFWQLLVAGLERSDLLEDPRFVDVKTRNEHKEALMEILDAEFSKQSSAHWVELFGGKVPMAPVCDLDQALNSSFVQQLGMIQSLPHSEHDNFRVVANPIKLDGARLPGEGCSALGADTDSLLQALGYDADQRAALREAKTV